MFALLVLFNIYCLWRIFRYMKKISSRLNHLTLFVTIGILFVVMSVFLLLGALLPYSSIRTFFHIISNYWLGFFIEFVTFTLLVDLIMLVVKLVNRFHPVAFLHKPIDYGVRLTLIFVLSLGCTVYGAIHAEHLYTNSYEAEVSKDANGVEDLNIVVMGDLHLGYSVGLKEMQAMVDSVNALNPDIIILAGDAFDNEYEAIAEDQEIIETLQGLKSKYGLYATWGNHDVTETLVGGFPVTNGDGAMRDPRMTQFLTDCGFTLIEDDTLLIDNSFYLIGRKDTERAGDGTKNRKTIEELTQDLDASLPWIVINHEPDELDETAAVGADLSLSGHTHAGQFFPLTIVQPFRWKNHWGCKQFDQLWAYTTSGVGVYGPPLRIATDAEIMQIQVHFTGK